MADMSYLDKLADLSKLSDAEIAELRKNILSTFAEADTNDDLDAMAAAADALDQVRDAMAQRKGTATPNTETLGGQDNVPTDTGADTQPVAASADEGETAPTEVPVTASAPDPDPVPDPETDPEADTADGEAGEDEPAEEGAADETDAADTADTADAGDGVTAAGLPAALKDHQFKKKGDAPPAEGSVAEEDTESKKKEDEEDGMTAASSTTEESTVAVEQTDIPEDRRPLVATSVTTVLAGADIPQRAAGSEFTSYDEVSEAFVNRLQTLRSSRGGDGDKIVVASVQSTVDPSRELFPGDDASNARKIDEITRGMQQVERTALVASGGYCAPLETRYDIFGIGVTDRPVRDSLAGFQATRGGIRYVQPPVLASFSGAVGLWTAANDASPSSPATKPFMTAACQQEVTVTADAVTLEIQFGNLMTRAYPELVARNNELGLIYQARFAEQTLLSKISALSTAVSATWQLGTALDLLNSIGRLASAYRTRHRLQPDVPLRVLAPAWGLDGMREDLVRGHPSSDPEEGIVWADALINTALAARNINITWHLDDSNYTGAQNAGTINDFPATIRYWLFAEGTFLFLDGGTLDLGIVRDSALVGTNDYRMFVETFEGLAKVGVESIQATVTTHITGASVGTITPS